MQLAKIQETALYFPNNQKLEEAEDFYRNVLGLELYEKLEQRHVFLNCGDARLLLFNTAESSKGDRPAPPHGTTGEGHMAFLVSEDELDAWEKHLIDHDITIEKKLDWKANQQSIYFRDPGNNSIELITS